MKTRRGLLKWLAGAVAAVPAVVLGVKALAAPATGGVVKSLGIDMARTDTYGSGIICEWTLDGKTGSYSRVEGFKGGGGFFHEQQSGVAHLRDCEEHFAKDVLGVDLGKPKPKPPKPMRIETVPVWK